MPFMMKLMVQHTGDTFPTLTNLDYLTNHISLKLSSFLQIERSVFITTGIFTRVDYLRIKEQKLTIEISGFRKFHGFSYQQNSL